MSIYVFLGPTLSVADARAVLDAEYRPPAAVGDVYRAARKRPKAIAIVDGYFARTPAIWHKEVLWAMAEGVHVFGSSSMGALRAAELADFGMQGVGQIFIAYHSGALVDDDEVAVAHASAAENYRASSDAMVNIRATLANAARADVIAASALRHLENLAKSLFYPERNLRRLARLALERGLIDEAEALAFEVWLPQGRVDQKRLDALQLLQHLSSAEPALSDRKRVSYVFEHTHTWEELLREVGATDEDEVDDDSGPEVEQLGLDILDELKLEGRFLAARRAALGRVLALEEVARMGRRVSSAEVRATSEELRRRRGLFQPDAFRGWMADNDLDLPALERFLQDEASIGWLDQGLSQASELMLLDHLRFSGEYVALRARAARLGEALQAAGHDQQEPELPPQLPAASLWRWYFEETLRRPVPDNLAGYAALLGFADTTALQTAVLKRFLANQEQAAMQSQRDPVFVTFKKKELRSSPKDKIELFKEVITSPIDFVTPGSVKDCLPNAEARACGLDINRYEAPILWAKLTPEEVEAMRRHPDVEDVTSDLMAEFSSEPEESEPADTGVATTADAGGAQKLPVGVKRVRAPSSWERGRGQSVKVAILDSGIEKDHPDLKSNYRGGVNLHDHLSNLMISHGTHCAGIVAAARNAVGVVGVAPSAELYSVKVSILSGSTSALMAGIDWCVDNKIDIINISREYPRSKELEKCCNVAYDSGILIVASAGNLDGPGSAGPGGLPAPACYPSVIAVSGINDDDSFGAAYSRSGAKVELCAPGTKVRSTMLRGQYGASTGTSPAAPHVTGAAAVVWSVFRKATNVQVRQILTDTADRLAPGGRSDKFGFGCVNVAKAAERAFELANQ